MLRWLFADGLIGESVQMPRGNVLFRLLVPRRRVELGEPIAKCQKLLAGKPADRNFYFAN